MTEQPELKAASPESMEEIEGVADKARGKDVKINDSIVGSVNAQANADINDSIVGAVGAGQDISFSNGGAIAIGAGRNIDVRNGGGYRLRAGNDIHIQNGGGGLMACKQAVVDNSTIGVLLTPQAALGENVKVMMSTRQAVAFGAAFGLVAGFLCCLFCRRR